MDTKISRLAAVWLFSLALAGPLSAHDMWLVTSVAGARGRVCARIGEHFPLATNGVSKDRVDLFQVRTADGAKPLAGAEGKKQFCAPLPNPSATAAAAEIVVHPRFIQLDAKDFNSYIEGEGFADVIRARQQSGKTGAEGRELYSRASKLLIGKGGELEPDLERSDKLATL
ncbi:MAG: hypothetical protein L0099_06290, partial [Acidobacteria bacterium]|nr:hypothetical protein [Acidobacteriota bacterium]